MADALMPRLWCQPFPCQYFRSLECVLGLTLSSNCLGDVEFNPPLRALKVDAIASGHINNGAKIHFKLARTEPGWFATCSASGRRRTSLPFLITMGMSRPVRGEHGASYSGITGIWRTRRIAKILLQRSRKIFAPMLTSRRTSRTIG